MYAILPACVSSIFLCYGLYVLASGNEVRASVPFFFLCFTTFAWQCTWVFLFESEYAEEAKILAKVGYVFILFIPAVFYHFAVEVANRKSERLAVFASYLASAALMAILLGTNKLISGTYAYFFGDYPKAGPLFFLHLIQTIILAVRVFIIIMFARRSALGNRRNGFSLCLIALVLYYVAMIDYAANYGYAFYPPGVVFVAVSLGVLAFGMVRLGLVKPFSFSVNLTNKVYRRLTDIEAKNEELATSWPKLVDGYRKAVEFELCEEKIKLAQIERVSSLISFIPREVDKVRMIIRIAMEIGRGENMEFSKSGELSVSIKIDENQEVTYTFRKDKVEVVTIHRVSYYDGDELEAGRESFGSAEEVHAYFDKEIYLKDHMRRDLVNLAVEKLKSPIIDGEYACDPVPDAVKDFVRTGKKFNKKGSLQ